jgi:hypothetical protein
MTAEQIRERGVDVRNPAALEAFKVEILQELAAQVAELNETLYNAFNGERITRIQVEPGQWPLAVALKPER